MGFSEELNGTKKKVKRSVKNIRRGKEKLREVRRVIDERKKVKRYAKE